MASMFGGCLCAPEAWQCGAWDVMYALKERYGRMIRTLKRKQAQTMDNRYKHKGYKADPALYTNRPDVYNQFKSFADAMRGEKVETVPVSI